MKATIFFCDIRGTIEGRVKNKLSDYEKFNELILKIKEKNNSDFIIFSLISSDNVEYIKQNYEYLNEHFSDSITFGKQFFDEGYIDGKTVITGDNGKCNQIINYLNELSESYYIDNIILADDLSFLHEMLYMISEDFSWKNKISSIIPTQGSGLSEINHLIQTNLLEYQKVMK